MEQRRMPMVGEAKPMSRAPSELIERCKNRLDAIRLCVQLSGMTNEFLSRKLGVDKGHWTRIMQGQAHFPDTKSVQLMEICGNYAPIQFELHAFNLPWPVSETKAERAARLRAEADALERAA